MSPVVKRKGERFTLPSKYLLFILTILCTIMMLVTFGTNVFNRPFNRVVGYVIVPFEQGIAKAGEWLANRSDELVQIRTLLAENSARIISRDSGNWYSSFVIDKGSNDGLADDMNVIAGGGLVGRITSVGPNWSRVTSIISDNSNVSGMTLATGDNLIVSGDLQMMAQGVIPFSKLVDSQDAVAEGDKVVTSDISDKYLPNILIGYISTINKDTNNLTKSGYLTPVVDFEHLSEVLVITDKKQQVPGGGADGE